MRFFAFLRAINVGRRVVKMERLRHEFEALGFSQVETLIASGNVIFATSAKSEGRLRERIERQLEVAFGFGVDTFLRSQLELAAVADHPAFPDPLPAGHAVLVAFLHAPLAAPAAKKIIAGRNEIDDFHLHGREVYWLCRARLSDSRFSGARLEKIAGQPATLRNLTTVRRLAAKYCAEP